MNLLQVILLSVFQPLSDLLPLDSHLPQRFFTDVLGWETGSASLHATIKGASLLGVLVFFRHDFLSILSSLLGVIAYRKKPMTIDERLPFFILVCATLPILTFTFAQKLWAESNIPTWAHLALSLSFVGLLSFSERMNRRSKAFYDWTLLESVLMGVGLCLGALPGLGYLSMALLIAFLRNFNREAAAKFAFLILAPYLAFQALLYRSEIDGTTPLITGGEQVLIEGLSLNHLGVALVFATSLMTTLFCLSTWMKSVDRGAIRSVLILRVLLILAVPITAWMIRS